MRLFLFITLLITYYNAFANVFQYFTGITYNNPAELFKVKHNEAILGGTGFYVNGQYNGMALNFNTLSYNLGSSVTQNVDVLPYGRIATRINDKLVFGVDVTEPFTSNLYWGRESVTRFAATETLITDVDVSPRFSFNLFPKFYIGAGIDLNFLKNNETNWALPNGPTTDSILVNRSSSLGVGYNLGFYYMINETNFIGATYYSAIHNKTRGTSTFNGNISTDLSFTFRFPPTTLIDYVHIFSPKWLIDLKVIGTEWDVNQAARFYHTAAQPPAPSNFIFPTLYKESWAYNAAVRHQFTDQLGLTLIGLVDFGPERAWLRPVGFPSDTIYFMALSADYHLSKTTTIELLYGHGYSKTMINNRVTVEGNRIPLTSGRIHFNVDVLDLKIKVDM